FFSSRRRHTRFSRDWSSDVCSSDLPNVNANTHEYITTGLEENKFGINSWEFNTVIEKLKTLQHIRCIGLHFHIGSQITDDNAFKSLCVKVNEFRRWFADRDRKSVV